MPNADFASTRWSVVVTAGRGSASAARDALALLCRTYWYPVYAYVRRRGHSPPDAQDLTQAFFARLLERNWVAQADQQRGRFRSFLLSAVNHFLANEWRKAGRHKRGGSAIFLPLDAAEARLGHEPLEMARAEDGFDRHWALALLETVLNRLRAEYQQDGRAALFDVLKSALPGGEETQPYEAMAQKLGMSSGAVRVAAHRLRQRYRHLLRAEITNTVGGKEDIDEELRYLVAVLAHQK